MTVIFEAIRSIRRSLRPPPWWRAFYAMTRWAPPPGMSLYLTLDLGSGIVTATVRAGVAVGNLAVGPGDDVATLHGMLDHVARLVHHARLDHEGVGSHPDLDREADDLERHIKKWEG